MNRDQFHQYLGNPEQLNSDSIGDLEGLVKEFPFFQAARMLYVKNLKNLDSIIFSKQLRYTAAYINNREFLFGLLNDISISKDGSFIPIEQDEKGQKNALPINSDILSLVDSVDNLSPENETQDIQGYEKPIYVRELERFIPIADMDLLLFDHPVEDEEILDFDFDGNLPDISSAEIDQGVTSKDLIDEFIRVNPRMPKPNEIKKGDKDISLNSLKESDAFMTETLAEIYLKQGYYYKALHAYEKLSLKYPEKSIYFASQIQKIKELITNQ